MDASAAVAGAGHGRDARAVLRARPLPPVSDWEAPLNTEPANPFDAIISQFGLVILDGGLATELERRGHELQDELWSAKVLLESPQEIRALHSSFYHQGADVATTATYQASFEGLARKG